MRGAGQVGFFVLVHAEAIRVREVFLGGVEGCLHQREGNHRLMRTRSRSSLGLSR